MKFSWKILNFFINIEKIEFNTFIEKLNLSGLEAEKSETNIKATDKIIYLHITTNRKEIFCIINLAIEVGTIFNLPLKVQSRPIKLIEPSKVSQDFSCLKFTYIKTHKIYRFTNNFSPKWLQDYLQACNIKPTYLLNDIQQYIYVKWGHKFYVFNLKKLLHSNNDSHSKIVDNDLVKSINSLIHYKQDYLYLYHQKDYESKQNIILYFVAYPINQYNLHNNQDTFMQAYSEAINLLTTYCKTIIGKSKEYYNNNLDNKDYSPILLIKKNDIRSLLGPIQNKKAYFLSNQHILNTLKQLNYLPTYLHNYKIFKVKIPNYRKHDLKRHVDIIEEIGRIYGLEKFLNKLPKYFCKGNVSLQYLQIRKIKNILYHIGFHEAITSSFVKEIKEKSNYTSIYNPLTQEQKNLRTNIIENLIDIYQQNSNNKYIRTEIFETGKIFHKNNLGHLISEDHLGGLISNNQYIQFDWSNPGKKVSWFHAKGIIENFFELIQANITWKNCCHLKSSTQFQHTIKYYHPNKKLFICDINNQEIIGIFGEIYSKEIDYIRIKNIYLFEINLNKLLKCIKYNKHFNYIIKPYSLYPSVTRDISIKIKNKTNISKIKKLFLKQSTDLAESIEIISDYYDSKKQQRSICIRIVYRSYIRTLNKMDIKKIDINIKNLFKILYRSDTMKMTTV